MPPSGPGSGPPKTPILVAAVASVFVLVLLGGGGAAFGANGFLQGLPPMSVVIAAVALGGVVWRSGNGSVAGFTAPALVAGLVLLSGRFDSPALLFTGGPLLALALAASVMTAATLRRTPPARLLLPAFFVIYACVSWRVQTRVGPDGDEPQYLMVADSLIRDHDLALDQDFKEHRYDAFFRRPLEPHFRIRGPEGQIYSLHAIGLSLLILPAYALFGYAGASFFMALLAALLVREVRRFTRELSGDDRVAEATAWLIGLSPPLIHFAGLIFTEVPAALLLCAGLRTAAFGRTTRSRWISALCAAGLPWFNVRYAILAAAVVMVLAARNWSERSPTNAGSKFKAFIPSALILGGSAVAISLFHYALWGFFDPRRVYGRRREFSLDVLPEGLPGLFFDQEFGLFIYAPVFALSIVGFPRLWRRHRPLAIGAAVACLGVIATASVWPMWRGGFNPPARFLVPLIGVLAAALAFILQRGIGASTALLAGWTLWCGIAGAAHIETIHRDRDGLAPFFRSQSGAVEWTEVLPSFVLPEDQATRSLALPWAGLLVVAALLAARRSVDARPMRVRDAAVASTAFLAVAMVAHRMSPRAPSPERNATRLLGAPAVAIPDLRLRMSSSGEWTAPIFFEPHRHPEGQAIASAVHLEEGQYAVTLTASARMPDSTLPDLLIRRRNGGAPDRRVILAMAATGAGVDFGVETPGDYDLLLIGGSPVELRAFAIRRVR